MKRFGWRLLIVLAACLLPGMAQSTCSQMSVLKLQNGLYNFQMNENDSSLEECATMNGAGFTITSANFANATNGPGAAYTSIYRGCHWGTCTISSPFPIEESSLASATTSLNLTQPPGYNNDAAYDIWFNQTARTTGQPNGAEVMIWLNHQGGIQPFGARVATVTMNGAPYDVWTGNQTSWKIVSYVASTPTTAVKNLNLLPFFADAVSRGSLDPSWWLIDVESGFEIWTGGNGLAISGFSVNATSRASRGAVPPMPRGVSKGTKSGLSCHIGYSIENQWPDGFKAAITIDNTGSTPWADWTLTWRFADGQTITNLWNGTATQTGAEVTVKSMSYDGAIGAGGSYQGAGFTGKWNNSTNSIPTSFAVNGTVCN